MTSSSVNISVGARGSRLSQAQIDEVYQEIVLFFPTLRFDPILWISTKGDQDKKTSLRNLEKTNFFTDEIDACQAAGEFRISIHSAKDLPHPLHPALEVVALTQGVDPSDSLVVKKIPLPLGARIGISSERREMFLKKWRPDLVFVDIRGTIEERLAMLEQEILEGVVIAEAALIRLGLTYLPRMRLPLWTPEMQGRLAVVARKNDDEMKQIFRHIHFETTKSPILYVGLDPSRYKEKVFHCPLIETQPLPLSSESLEKFQSSTHVILTSPSAARITALQLSLQNKEIIAIGPGTAHVLEQLSLPPHFVASQETQEGVIALLQQLFLEAAYIFYPRSSSARPLLAHYLKERQIPHHICDLYETVYLKPHPIPSLDDFKEIVFTSPSTIQAFRSIYGVIPSHKQLTCIGPITQTFLQNTVKNTILV